jgi:electron transfer flavoprotein alpha/beta subunit
MKVIVVIRNIIQIQQSLISSGYGHLAAAPKNIICNYDLNAISAVLTAQNTKEITETIAVSIGSGEIDPMLEYCLALGVNKAVKLSSPKPDYSLLDQAKMLHSYVKGFNEYVVIFAHNSGSNEINAIAPMLAMLLECSELNMAMGLKFVGDNCIAQYRKSLSIMEVKLGLPAVITINSSSSDVAAATLYDLMRVDASQIAAVEIDPNTGENTTPHKYYKTELSKKECEIFDDMSSLHNALKTVAIL